MSAFIINLHEDYILLKLSYFLFSYKLNNFIFSIQQSIKNVNLRLLFVYLNHLLYQLHSVFKNRIIPLSNFSVLFYKELAVQRNLINKGLFTLNDYNKSALIFPNNQGEKSQQTHYSKVQFIYAKRVYYIIYLPWRF